MESNKINDNLEKKGNFKSSSFLFDSSKRFKLIFELKEKILEEKKDDHEAEFMLPLKNNKFYLSEEIIFIFSKNIPIHPLNGENKYFTVFIINYNKDSDKNELSKSLIVSKKKWNNINNIF